MSMHFWETEQYFRAAWNATNIVRSKRHSLFTFGDTTLPYYLVSDGARSAQEDDGSDGDERVMITQGHVRIRRPLILTLDGAQLPFQNFVESDHDEQVIRFLLARTAQFSQLQIENERRSRRTVLDSVEAAVARLNRQLDDEEDEDVAILTAPRHLAGVALIRYTAEKVWESAPSNLQELRERGFLP